MDALEAEITKLVKEYPAAAHYLKWVDADPSSSMGFAHRQAATALENGESLETAKDAERPEKGRARNDDQGIRQKQRIQHCDRSNNAGR